MKNFKKAVLFLLVATMLLSLFAGCAGATGSDSTTKAAESQSVTEESTASAETENPLKDKIEISLAAWNVGKAFDNEQPDAVREKIYNDLNITIKPMNVTWDDIDQKIRIWAMSDELPDVFASDLIGKAEYSRWIDQGLVKALPSDLSPYPELEKMLNTEGFDIFRYPMGDKNGKFYMIPRLNHLDANDWATDSGVTVRKDWMEKVGVTKEPETMDEFIDLMVKFANNDCNGNNKKDEIGLSMYSGAFLAWFMLAYEPGNQAWNSHWVKDPNDASKWIPAFFSPKTLDGLKAIKKLYDAGGMDKDFASLKGEEGRDKFIASTAGAYCHDISPGSLDYLKKGFDNMPQNKGIDFESSIYLQKPFRNADGNLYRSVRPPQSSETYINAKCDDKKTDRILRFLNYYITEDGYNLTHFGIEGTDWHKEGSQIVLTPPLDSDGKVMAISAKYPICGLGFMMEWSGTREMTNPTTTPVLQKMSRDMQSWLKENAKPQTTNLIPELLTVPSSDKNTASFQDDLIKCVLSKDIEKTYHDMIAAYRANGYDTFIREINDECAKMGIKPE